MTIFEAMALKCQEPYFVRTCNRNWPNNIKNRIEIINGDKMVAEMESRIGK